MAQRFLIGMTAGALAVAGASGARAVTITSSQSVFAAAVAGRPVTSTQVTGLFDPFAFPDQATTSSIALGTGYSLLLSTPVDPAQPLAGDYPFRFSDGYAGDIFLPTDGTGLNASGTYNFVNTITVSASSSSLSALSFEVAPFSAAANGPPNASLKGPYTLTVTAGGQSLTVSEPGGSGGVTTPAFFGLYGGGITSFTITTSDPNGLAFGNFQSVPEPVSLTVMAAGLVALAGRRRRA